MTPSAETGAPAAERRPSARVPDFFIIGHEKCGTTALYRMLQQHPGLFLPELKETRFFVAERERAPARAPGPQVVRPRTLADYLALFAPAAGGQLAGEASPQYIRSPDAARLIAEVQPAARIIAILREPVSFLHTYHLNNVRELIEDERDMARALALEEERRHGRSLPAGARAPGRLMYADHVCYVEQLERFEAFFGRENMLVLIYEDFRRDNAATVAQVLRFLGVDENFTFAPSNTFRERKAVRTPRLHRLALALQLARRKPQEAPPVWRLLDRLTPPWLRAPAIEQLARRTVFARAAPIDAQLAAEMRRRFAPQVAALGEYLDRDLVGEWGYDRIN